MSADVPPKKNAIYTFGISLVSQADTKLLQNNPTLAAGDAVVSTDFGATANLATLPVVTPASSDIVKVTMSAAEMNGDDIMVIFSDAAGAQWCDLSIHLKTATRQLVDLAFPSVSGRSFVVETDGMIHVDLKEMLGDGVSVTDLKDFVDAGYDPATNKVQGVVLVDTTTANTDVGTAGASLTDLGGMSTGMKAEVNVEVDGALDTTIAELAQGVPVTTPTVRTALMLMYMALRNQLDVATSATDTLEIHNDAGTRIAQKLLTDAGGDYSEAKMISGA